MSAPTLAVQLSAGACRRCPWADEALRFEAPLAALPFRDAEPLAALFLEAFALLDARALLAAGDFDVLFGFLAMTVLQPRSHYAAPPF
jgi:hypothetical protein